MTVQDAHKTAQEALFCRKAIWCEILHLREQPNDMLGQLRIARNWTHDQLPACSLVRDFAGHEGWIEIKNPPAARFVTHRHAIVHLAGVHHDYVTSLGLDLTNDAPRPLRTTCHNPDANVVVRVARKGMVGKQGHRLNARYSRSMLHNAMHSPGHDCPMSLDVEQRRYSCGLTCHASCNVARSRNQLVATPKTSPQNGAPIWAMLTADDVTRKAVSAPKPRSPPKAVAIQLWSARNKANPPRTAMKATGSVELRPTATGAKIPNTRNSRP